MNTVIQLWFCVFLLNLTQASALRMHLKFSDTKHREKRESTKSMPDKLDMSKLYRGQDKSIHLTKVDPLTPFVDGHAVTVDTESMSVYRDSTGNHLMILERQDGDIKMNKGIFTENNQTWIVEPDEGENQDKSNENNDYILHSPELEGRMPYIVKEQREINFGNDALVSSDEFNEVIKTERGKEEDKKYWQDLASHADVKIKAVKAMKKEKEVIAKLGLAWNRNRNRNRKIEGQKSKTKQVVEMAVVVDYSAYKTWEDYSGNKAIDQLTHFYTFIMESVKDRYENVNLSRKTITTKVTYFEVIKNENKAVITEDPFKGENEISQFATWAENNNPVADHHALITANNFEGVGLAYVGRVCDRLGVSLNHDTGAADLSVIIAHELGHSLSARHDTSRACEASKKNIMSATVGVPYSKNNEGNGHIFSKCSVESFENYLDSITCTSPGSTKGKSVLKTPKSGERGGEFFDKSEQCKIFHKNTVSRYCPGNQERLEGGEEGTLCSGMYCITPSDPEFCRRNVLPLDYTPCSSGNSPKRCIGGKCQLDCDAMTKKCNSINRKRKRNRCIRKANKKCKN